MKKKKKDKKEGFPEFLSNVSGTDALVPERLMAKVYDTIAGLKILCGTCHSKKTIRIKTDKNASKEFVSIKCGCGCHVIYPPRSDREYHYLWMWIPKEDFDAHKTKRYTGKKG